MGTTTFKVRAWNLSADHARLVRAGGSVDLGANPSLDTEMVTQTGLYQLAAIAVPAQFDLRPPLMIEIGVPGLAKEPFLFCLQYDEFGGVNVRQMVRL